MGRTQMTNEGVRDEDIVTPTELATGTEDIRFKSYAGDKPTPSNGDVWYNSTTNKFRKYENGASIDLGSTGAVHLGSVLTVNGDYNGITFSVTVDDISSAAGNVLAVASDGNYDRANATAASTAEGLVMATTAGTGTVIVLRRGMFCNTSWGWTVGGALYLDTTAGLMTQTPLSATGNQNTYVGWALSATTIFFDPSGVLVEVS